MVEGARLESVYRGNSIEGSNPSLSAIYQNRLYGSTGSTPLMGAASAPTTSRTHNLNPQSVVLKLRKP